MRSICLGRLQAFICNKSEYGLELRGIKMNIGIFDRAVRLLTGLGVVLFDYVSSASWEVLFLAFGTWSVMTSVFGWCPFYRVFGVNTCPTTFNVGQEAATPESHQS
tara:strand:+ start:2564 stop:2881 length:318 start_codon:yes stop_codon:yes gene_type:complete